MKQQASEAVLWVAHSELHLREQRVSGPYRPPSRKFQTVRKPRDHKHAYVAEAPSDEEELESEMEEGAR